MAATRNAPVGAPHGRDQKRPCRSAPWARLKNQQRPKMPIQITCFKAYDVRGQIPNQLNPDIAYRIGNATAAFLGAKKIVLGRDMRLSSGELADEVARGLTEAGVEVLDIG